MQSVMFTGVRNQESILGIDAAARRAQRKRAAMLRIIVEDWLEAWRASGGETRQEHSGRPSWEKKNPLRGYTFDGDGLAHPGPKPADEGGVLVPFRPRNEESEA
jgi:hypothetical protein